MGEIYKITNIVNQKMYIGQTIRGYQKRFQSHISNSLNHRKNGCPLIENAIRKYGKESFKIELLHECDIEDLNDFEDYYINLFNTRTPHGYNLMSGGGNGRTHSQLTKDKMTQSRIGKTHSDITKKRMSDAQKGKVVATSTKKLLSEIRKKQTTQNYPSSIKNALKDLSLDTMPMYIYFAWDNRPGRHCMTIIVRHPDKPFKKFASKLNPISVNIKNAIEYLNT